MSNHTNVVLNILLNDTCCNKQESMFLMVFHHEIGCDFSNSGLKTF